MAIFNLEFSNSRSRKELVKADEHHDYVSRNGKYSPEIIDSMENQSALSHMEYVKRENAFSKKIEYEDLLYSEDRNMPEWAKENPNVFWKSSELYERANGRTYTEIRFALPHELSDEENKKLVDRFCEDTFGESFVYSYGIHSKPSSEENIQNIHVHIMFCERKLDGIKREAKQFFKRYNTKFPERGGAKKDRYWHSLKAIPITRNSWEKILNEKLEELGLEKVSAKSLEFQKIEARIAGDVLKEELLNRPVVNCSGNILMKLNKYGVESLTIREKEEYDLFLLAKELKKIHEKEYQLSLKEKNYELNEDLVKKVILDRSRNHFYNIKNNNNSYELLNDKIKQSFLGLGILNEENKNYSDKINMHIILESTLAKNNIKINKGDIKYINPNLEYENILFKEKDYIILENIVNDLESKIKNTELEKEKKVSEFRKNFNKWQKDYAKEILFALKNEYDGIGLNKAFFNEQFKKYSEIEKTENEIKILSKKINSNTYITKILDKNILNKKRNEVNKMKTELFSTISKFTKEKNLIMLYTKYLAEAILKEDKNTSEYREKENIFNDFYKEYSKLDEELKIQKIALQYSKDERNRCYSEYQKNIKSLNSTSEKKYFNKFENNETFQNKENNANNLKELVIKYQNIYSTVKSLLKNKEKYENIINDEEKLKNIAAKSGNSITNVRNGYNRSINNILKEYEKHKTSITIVLNDIKAIFKDIKTSELENIYKKLQIENKKLEKKLFANLDKAKIQNDKSKISQIFNDMFVVQNKIKALNILFRKEDILNFSEKTKKLEKEISDSSRLENSIKKKIKQEKTPEDNLQQNNIIRSRKNVKDKSSEAKGIYLETPKKRKNKSLFDLDEEIEI